MWLATKYGFFSFSNLGDGGIAIRSRVRGDLQNLQEFCRFLEIHCIAGQGEYGWEATLEIEEASALFALILQANSDGDHLGQAVYLIPGLLLCGNVRAFESAPRLHLRRRHSNW